MATITAAQAGSQNVVAFLDMIAISELGPALLKASDDGYNVIVGSTASKPILFHSYASHPNRLIKPPLIPVPSSAAGRYQLLAHYFDTYKVQLRLPDFGPLSQDRIAIQQIRERRALPLLLAGDFKGAVEACNTIWASLTGSPYKQHTHPIDYLAQAYTKAGGIIV
jgi:muramidase (phage lysozyme)